MTKDQFVAEMFKWVTYHKQKLEQMELRRTSLPTEIASKHYPVHYNPFIEFAPKYFNIKILSNLQGLKSVIYHNPEINVYQTKLFIMSNTQFKVLNDLMNYNPYLVEELCEDTHSPMDIAIGYAIHNQQLDRFKNMQKR